MFIGKETLKYKPLDPLGELCMEGLEVANYLFQVPDDEGQWKRLRGIVDGVLKEAAGTKHRELSEIAAEMKQTLAGTPSVGGAQMLQAGFDRIVKLWKLARSGIN